MLQRQMHQQQQHLVTQRPLPLVLPVGSTERPAQQRVSNFLFSELVAASLVA
jgi:hypothetical protein